MIKRLLSMGICLILVSMIAGCSLSDNLYQDGKKSFVDGNYEEAAVYFEAAIKENPNRADYYIDYGMSLIKLNQYEAALAEFDKAYVNKDVIIVNRNNKRLYRGKGIAYYYMLDYENAIVEFNKALDVHELSELDVDILYYIGSSFITIGAYDEAIKTYTKLIKRNKNTADAYNSRALCYRNQGDYELSLADYDAAIKLEPKNFSHYFGMYYLLAESGDEVSANEVLKMAAELTMETSADQYNLAKVHFYQGNYEEALSELSEGFKNGFTEAYYYIGEIYRIKKDYPKAVYYYDIFIEEGEIMAPNVYNQIASSLIKIGDYSQALNYLEQGIAYNHAATMKTLKKNEIIAYECLGEFAKAKEKLTQYLATYPKDEEAKREAQFVETRVAETVTETNKE
jgi:tetratricopeptide (TPR) repeat protein